MGEISQFIAMPFDLTEDGLVAGEPFKCLLQTAIVCRPCDAMDSEVHRYNGGWWGCGLWRWHLTSWDASLGEALLFAVPLGSGVHSHPCRMLPVPSQEPP
jgi:hypothetical protein